MSAKVRFIFFKQNTFSVKYNLDISSVFVESPNHEQIIVSVMMEKIQWAK